MSVVIESELARSLAIHFSPTIYQEWSSIKDCLTPLVLDKDVMLEKLAEIIEEPTLYYSIREDDDHWYAYYMKYHPFDWSNSGFCLIRLLDSHKHDSEGMLFRIQKKSERIDVVTVYHYDFLFASSIDRKVTIEREGHGIYPYSLYKPVGSNLVYKSFSYVNLNDQNKRWWNEVREAFGGNAKMPDEQFASRVLGSPSLRRKNKRGDIFLRPEVLFQTAIKKGWISK